MNVIIYIICIIYIYNIIISTLLDYTEEFKFTFIVILVADHLS